LSKRTKRIAKLERKIARIQTHLPKAADRAVRAALDMRSTTQAVGFATVYPTVDWDDD
jgi:hypothetical protein